MRTFSKLILIGSTFCFAFTAINVQAALPPFYESVKEYKALLASPELANQISPGEMIRDIQRDEQGFLVTSLRQTLQVDVVYDPISQPGPAKFHLVFHTAQPIHEQDVK